VDPNERGKALDLLGFDYQVIYSSLCATAFDIADPALRYAAYRAHNEGMAEFCSADPRLLGVALCDLDDAERSRTALEHALALGLKLVWIPARAPAKVSPGHNQHDWFWATLAERRVPFVLHVGSGPLPIAPEWTINGRAPPERAPVAEVITSKDLMVVYQPVERFLSVLVLDGVLERHPALRGGAIEMGAGWVPAMLRRLDHAVDIWSKSEVELRQMTRKPSEQASAQLRFTPYPFEDVGQLCRESHSVLYLFSSDRPLLAFARGPRRTHAASVLRGKHSRMARFVSKGV
jgi:uncharacterized protein